LIIACQGVHNSTQPISSPIITAQYTPTINIIQPSATSSPTAAFIQLTATPTATLYFTVTPGLIESPTATKFPFVMCSPLGDETIPSLWEIITNPYDPPPVGSDAHHHGVDFAYYRRGDRLSIQGEVVQTILSGRVAASVQDRLPYGNMVIIETLQESLPISIVESIDISPGESLYTLYAHMEGTPQVGLGDRVECGQVLGTVGTTGYHIVNPHLHLETRIGLSGEVFDSMTYYDTGATQEEMDNYLRWRLSGEFKPFDPMLLFAAYLEYVEIDPHN
jgi:murein DD-endopeptidase MepM/ murein hydrolase activator NlpD